MSENPRPPWAPWVLALLFLVLAVAMTPSVLVSLGPMRRSLTSENELTRKTAESTVVIARVACAVIAGTFLLAAVFHRSLSTSAFARSISLHEPLETPRHSGMAGRWVNLSFVIMAMSALLGVAYVVVAPELSDSVRGVIQREDGVIELGTAFVFLGACIGATLLGVKYLRWRGKPGANRSVVRRAAWWFALAFFFFFCVGEEVSWGQRIFGWETPEELKRVNVQDETNLHNLLGYLADHLFIAGVVLYGGLMPLLSVRSDWWRRAIDWVGLPMASQGLAVGFLVVSCMQNWLVFRIVPNTTGLRVAELRELLVSIGFALLAREAWLLLPDRKSA